jgi:hypothetical protein
MLFRNFDQEDAEDGSQDAGEFFFFETVLCTGVARRWGPQLAGHKGLFTQASPTHWTSLGSTLAPVGLSNLWFDLFGLGF